MSESFNALFNRLLRQAEAKQHKRTRKPRALYTGDTAAGRAAATGEQRKPEIDDSTADHRGNYQVREYRQNPGATKGRGKLGGIRK